MISLPEQAEIHRKCTSESIEDRLEAASLLDTHFSNLPDKDQAWRDLIRLIQDEDYDVQMGATRAMGAAFVHVPDKSQAWRDLIRLAQDEDFNVKVGATYVLGSAFVHIPDKDQAWQDLHSLTENQDSDVRMLAADALGTAFAHVPCKDQAWQDLHRLTRDPDGEVQWLAAGALGSAFAHVPDQDQAWQDLHRLTQDPGFDVRSLAAEALGTAFAHVPCKDRAWQDLHRLAHDDDRHVRMFAYHSLGRASIFKATGAKDNGTLKSEFEAAVDYFEKSSQESGSSPAKFCHPFYRTYLAITFQDAREDEVQKYIAEAKESVGSSKSKDDLLKAVENLAEALRRSQSLKTKSFEEIKSELNTYRWYCEKAAEHMAAAEDEAPGAVKLMRKCNPLIEERILFTINEIQDIARQICQITAGRGPGADAFCGQIRDAARSLSTADLNEILMSISDLDSILRDKVVLLPEGERDLVESQLDEIAHIGPIPEKLDKIKVVVKFYLSRMKDDEVLQEMSKKLDEIFEEIKALRESLLNRFESSERKILFTIFERLDKDKLEIVRDIFDAAEKDKIPKELVDEILKATTDLISEIKSAQVTIRDPDIASWDEALKSSELNVENKLKVSIPIIPLLLTYEGSYSFQSGLLLEKTWNELSKFIQDTRRSF